MEMLSNATPALGWVTLTEYHQTLFFVNIASIVLKFSGNIAYGQFVFTIEYRNHGLKSDGARQQTKLKL